MSEITENRSDLDGMEHRFAVGEELEALRRGESGWEEGKVIEIDREGYGKKLSELPLYEVVQEIEAKWDPMKYHMVIEAMLTADSENELEAMHTLSDNQLLPDDIPEGPGEASLGTVNLLDIREYLILLLQQSIGSYMRSR